jgi:hypothetical protein
MVIGNLDLRDVTRLLADTQETIFREINPHIHSEDEFRKKIKVAYPREKDYFFRFPAPPKKNESGAGNFYFFLVFQPDKDASHDKSRTLCRHAAKP